MGWRHGRDQVTKRIHLLSFNGATGVLAAQPGEPISQAYPRKVGVKEFVSVESNLPRDGGGLISEGHSEGGDSRTSLSPREPPFVHLSTSTVYVHLNHLLLNVIQQRLFSETPQTTLNYLGFSKSDVPLSPSFGRSRPSLPAGTLRSCGWLGPPRQPQG